MNKKQLALFDFDGTVTKRDTFLAFLWKTTNPRKFFLKSIALLPVMCLYTVGFISAQEAKERIIAKFIKGKSSDILPELGEKLIEDIDKMTRVEALDAISWHRDKGHELAIVSATFTYLKPWACKHGIHKVMCSELEERNGKLTGKIKGLNCNGIEKVKRINNAYNNIDRESIYIYAYGNSRGDLEMLEFADESYYRTWPIRKENHDEEQF